eukprot:1428488-Pleurochrysis_carterae.AAC.1
MHAEGFAARQSRTRSAIWSTDLNRLAREGARVVTNRRKAAPRRQTTDGGRRTWALANLMECAWSSWDAQRGHPKRRTVRVPRVDVRVSPRVAFAVSHCVCAAH